MYLLIPTNDGFSIASELENTNKFRSLSVQNGSVEMDEIKIFEGGIKNKFFHEPVNKIIGNIAAPLSELHYIIIANSISNITEKQLNENNIEVLLTTETNITNAIIYYLKYHSIHESDYCCCP